MYIIQVKSLTYVLTILRYLYQIGVLGYRGSEQELDNINKTIEQTESGYKKILEAGETLMSVVSENIAEYKNIDYKPINSD